MVVSRFPSVLFLATVLPLSAIAGIADLTGSWSVASNYPGRTVAVFTVNPDGSVKTILPKIPDDTPLHLMDGGKMIEKDGKFTFFGASGMFERYAASFGNTPMGKAFRKLEKNGVPMQLEGTGADRRLVPVVDPILKNWFMSQKAMSPEEVTKATKDREEQRREIESYPWTVNEVKPCTNSDLLSTSLNPGSEKLLTKLFKPGSTFRFRRNTNEPEKNRVEFSAASSAEVKYYASHTEKSVGIVWRDGSKHEQIKLMDLGLPDSTKVGVHRFHADIGGKCMEIVAGQQRGGGASADGQGEGKDLKPAL